MYRLRIQAVNKFGPSEYSANIEFTTLSPLPKAPVFSQYTNLTSNSVRLEWNMLVDEILNSDTDDMDNVDGDADTAGDDTSTDNYVNDETEEKIHSDETKEVNVEDGTNVKSNSSSRLSNPLHHHHQQQRERLKRQNVDLKPDESQLIFTLQMSRESDLDWTTIYEGQSNMHKVNRLSEFTIYHFRVCAMNTTGCGLYSGIQTIRTQKASPPAVRGLKILELNSDRCQLEWTPVNQLGMDPIIYLLHLLPVTANIQQSTNLNQVYRGNQTACRITGLNPGSEYVCRVCAVRLCQPTAKLPVINNSTTTFEQEQSKDNPKIDSSQYQITELPGPFSPGLLFTTPRLTKDTQFDSTSSSVSPSPSVTVSASCHLFRQKDSLSYKRSNGLLKILSSPYYIIRNMISRNSSNIRSTSVYPIHDSSNWTTLSKQDHIHSNQVIATGTSPNSPLHNNNVSDKRRSILLHTISSTTSLSTQSTTNSTSSPRNQSKQQLSSHHNSKRSHSHWFRFTDTQLACLLLILFSLATLLVAMSLQYVLNVHLKLSNPTTTSSSGSSGSFSSMDLSPSSSESYGMRLKLNHDKKNNDGSSVFTTTTTTSKRTNQNVHS
ncbi:factor for adipocyte differentiation, putative [Schistosoma mansoni]|uniref:factor for adipocyte differentiation, putative n=1 Tax=Schistosoma mansoni TaxID=6183 RepID=UPI0001A62D6D|nr:factor for adipocyte differentiation, putative [Schistosoma mansoni]|eukprot:XP_018646179.1 factor for adipocyte differentiation, putative [Schistosoma mansoni]